MFAVRSCRIHRLFAAVFAALSLLSAARAQCPLAPVGNPVVSNGRCNIVISWLPSPGAINYFVYRGTSDEFSAATLIGATSAFSLTDVPPTRAIDYHYWVRAMPNLGVCTQQGGLAYAGFADFGSMDPPTLSSLGCTGIQITWSPMRDATSYNVARYRKNLLDEWVFETNIATNLPGGPALDLSGIPGVTYNYAVFASGGCSDQAFADGAVGVFPGVLDADVTSAAGNIGTSISLSAAVSIRPQTPSFQWLRSGQPLANSAKYSGVNTSTLSIWNLDTTDAGEYQVVITTPCKQITKSAVVAVTSSCRADFNGSGAVSVQDIFDFLAAYFAGFP